MLGAIERSGYVVNPAARVLAGRRMGLTGVLTPRYNSPYVTELIQGASAAAEDAGMTLAVLTTSGNAALERERGALLRTLADGVLLIVPGDEPRVFQGVVAGGSGTYGVQTDNRHGGYLAARHLLDLGHRAVAHIRGGKTHAFSRQESEARERGFLEGLGEAGVSVPPSTCKTGTSTKVGVRPPPRSSCAFPSPPPRSSPRTTPPPSGCCGPPSGWGCGCRVTSPSWAWKEARGG